MPIIIYTTVDIFSHQSINKDNSKSKKKTSQMLNIEQNPKVCAPSFPQGKLHEDDSSNAAW